MQRVQSNGQWSLFCPNESPGLADCWGEEFEALYTKYEREVKKLRCIWCYYDVFFLVWWMISKFLFFFGLRERPRKLSRHRIYGLKSWNPKLKQELLICCIRWCRWTSFMVFHNLFYASFDYVWLVRWPTFFTFYFQDTCNRKSNQQNLGTIKSSNLCTEIIEYTSPTETAVCNLASIALPRYVREKVIIDICGINYFFK